MTEIQRIDCAIKAAIQAGKEILKIYRSEEFDIQLKADNTPVTMADRNAHDKILQILQKTGLPVLSEEGVHLRYSERKHWKQFWMIDPLDGTKEFIKRNDEFTVNIALIDNCQSVAGVVYAPVTRALYAAIAGTGAFRLLNPDVECDFRRMQNSGVKLPERTTGSEYVVAISRSHMNLETEAYIEKITAERPSVRVIRVGSSLKICMVAEGTANAYPKIGTTMEWDTAAAHAVIKAAGKNIFHWDLKTELAYNKEDLQNPHFIAT